MTCFLVFLFIYVSANTCICSLNSLNKFALRRVGALGLRGFETSSTDGPCGVHGFSLTVGYVSEII